jgi:eukaryotic-like serine/threonine-protein kinase
VGIDYRQRWRRPMRWGAVGGDLTGLAIVLTVAAAVAVLGGCSCRLSEPPASSSPEAMAARIREVADGLSCASMTVTVAADGAIHVWGFVSGAEDLDQLRSVAGSSGDSGQLNLDGAVVYDGSGCRKVVKILADKAPPSRQGTAPRLDFNIPSLVYKGGDKLLIAASATSAFDGYLYVDYFDREGNVIHLLPARDNPNNELRAGQRVRVGSDQYVIGPPFGPDLVVAISSPTPLFPLRTDLETADFYLPVLTKALTDAANDARDAPPIVSYTLINTVAR